MVSASEARQQAIYEGALERRRRTGGWKQCFVVLTASDFCCFENSDSASTRSVLPTVEILSVAPGENDATQRVVVVHLYRKKKEFRALSAEERGPWLEALQSVAAFKLDGSKNEHAASVIITTTEGSSAESSVSAGEPSALSITALTATPTAPTAAPPNGCLVDSVDLARLCDAMKKAFSREVQTSKSFAASDVISFAEQYLHASRQQAIEIGQKLVDARLLIPLKSHVFGDDGGVFRFQSASPLRQPKNHLTMRSESVAALMGSGKFDATKYAEDFLRKHSSDKIDEHCQNLVVEKEKTTESLKEEISTNYSAFIRASAEIKVMENTMSQLHALVVECKRSIQTLKSISPNVVSCAKTTFDDGAQAGVKRGTSDAEIISQFLCDAEVLLHEHSYERFVQRLLQYRTEKETTATDQQKAQMNRLVQEFVTALVNDFQTAMQTSERMHKKEDHIKWLIQIGEAALATEMCLQNYSVHVALQLRLVPANGNALNFVINLSRTFFTSLLVCYEDYELSFRGQRSSHFQSLTTWISSQLERFSHEVLAHIFPSAQDASAQPRIASDVAALRDSTKFVANALRYVFYGSRQLELAGLPTAHCLAPHLSVGVLSFLASYAASITAAVRMDIKRERWDTVKHTIRDSETKQERDIFLTHSARTFYSLLQQFLRDAQRILNPSCATSYIPEIQEAVVRHADDFLIHYSSSVLAYLENTKLSSALRLKQIVGMLSNVAYIYEDCVTRSQLILQEFLPKSVLLHRNVQEQNTKAWKRLVVQGLQRCAQSLLQLAIRWQDLDLSDEVLPDPSHFKDVTALFVSKLRTEMAGVSVPQLETALRSYRAETSAPSHDDGTAPVLTQMVVESMLVEISQDEGWWSGLRQGSKVGYGGLNRFITELRALAQGPESSTIVVEMSDLLSQRLVGLYKQAHPGKQDIFASETWIRSYTALCSPPSSPSSFSSTQQAQARAASTSSAHLISKRSS